MATYTVASFYQGLLNDTDTEIIPDVSTKMIIKEIILCNTSANIIQIDIKKLLSGENVPAAKNILFNGSGLVLQGYETKQIVISQVLEIGESLWAKANTAGAVACNICGVSVS